MRVAICSATRTVMAALMRGLAACARSARRVPEERTSEGSGPTFERVRLRTDLCRGVATPLAIELGRQRFMRV